MDLRDVARQFPTPTLQGLHFERAWALYLLAAVALLLIFSIWQADGLRTWAAPLLRTLVLVLFVFALANPHSVVQSEGAVRPVVIDASASITPAMRAYAVDLLRDQLKIRDSDPAILFGGHSLATTFGAATRALKAGCAECDPASTNIESALNALAADRRAHQGAIALVTDGWQDRGNVDNAIGLLRAAGIQLYIFTPPGAEAVPNIAMTQLSLPPALPKAQPFAVGVSLSNLNDVPAAGTVALYRNGALLDRRSVTLAPGQTRIDFPVRAGEAGLSSYRAVFKPANPALDNYPEDDSLEGWVGIGAQRKVLILTDTARDANYLDTAIRRMGLLPTVLTLNGGSYNGNPKGYDAVILNNVPRSRLAPSAQAAIVQYVRDGGALAMVGGDQSFGLGGFEGSSIANIMPVVMKPPEHHERERALILIIDKSGSMGRNNKLVYAKAAALTVVKSLRDSDMVGVIGFDSQPFVVVPFEPLAQIRPYFNDLIDRLKARGTTYLMPALEEADRTLRQSGAAIKHVVILTDGETGGTAAMYYDLVSSMHHDQGATISAIAVGREANLPLLESIAKYGGGGFYQTDSPENLPDLFIEDVRQRGGGDTTLVEKEFVPYSASPDPLLKDLAGRRLPAIKGFVATDLKPGATLSMFVDSNGHRSPIIASWKNGAGKVLAVTTDASGRWSSAWIHDGIFAPLWDKLVAWMTPPSATKENYSVALGYRAGRITMNLTDYSEDASASAAPIDAIITGPDGNRFETSLSQEAPGELTGSFDAPTPGTYQIALKILHASGESAFPPLAYTISAAINAEVPRPAPNYGLLERLASATGGRLNPAPSELAVSRPMFRQSTSLNPWLVVTGMVLLIVEALVRRLTF